MARAKKPGRQTTIPAEGLASKPADLPTEGSSTETTAVPMSETTVTVVIQTPAGTAIAEDKVIDAAVADASPVVDVSPEADASPEADVLPLTDAPPGPDVETPGPRASAGEQASDPVPASAQTAPGLADTAVMTEKPTTDFVVARSGKSPNYAPTDRREARRGGLGGMIFGGMIAAGLGALAVIGLDRGGYGLIGAEPAPVVETPVVEAPVVETPVVDVAAVIAASDARMAMLEAALTELSQVSATSEGLSFVVGDVNGRIDALRSELAALEARQVEPAPVAGTDSETANRLAAAEATLGILNRSTAMEASVAARIADLQSQLDALPRFGPVAEAGTETGDAVSAAVTADLARISAEVDELRGRAAPDEFAARLAAVETAIAAIETSLADTAQIVADAEAAAAARMAEAEAEAARLRSEVESGARLTAAAAATDLLVQAFSTGGALEPALADLAAAGVSLPDDLKAALTAAPTLAALRVEFPEAARAALADALSAEQTEGAATDRLAAFLRNQTGARALEPREGDDADAIQSRAEAALTKGDLPGALAELAALPPEAMAAMAPWTRRAELRRAAEAALAAFAPRLK